MVDGTTTVVTLASTAIFDPATGVWGEGTCLTMPLSGQTAATLGVGRMLIVGGDSPTGQGPTTAELYDPQSRTWTALREIGVPSQVSVTWCLYPTREVVSSRA